MPPRQCQISPVASVHHIAQHTQKRQGGAILSAALVYIYTQIQTAEIFKTQSFSVEILEMGLTRTVYGNLKAISVDL